MTPARPIDKEPPPLEGSKRMLATLAVALATFMNVLDSSIANVAIPTISGNLGVSIDEGTWVITLFAAANAVSIPLTGWLTRRVGQIRLFVATILLFVVSSWLCGVAPTLPMLLAARVLQGVVAGPMIPLSQAILLGSYPKEKSSTALALWAMTATVGPIAGPLLGGWITDNYSWSWIFYINVPIGLFAAGVTWLIYRDRETPTGSSPIDTVGLALLVTWVATLQVMLDKGKDLDWFNSPVIVGLGVVALIAFSAFIAWELTDEHPIVDLHLFKGRNFLAGTIAISVAFGVYFANLVILPQWMQQWLGYPAAKAGLATAPLGVFAVLLTPVLGRLMPKANLRVLATLAFLGFAGVFFLRAGSTTDIDIRTLVLPTLLQGIPTALFFVPLTAILLSGLPPERIPAAAGLSNFVRVFCGAVGTSLATTAWSDRSILHHAQLVEQISPNNPIYGAALDGIQSALGVGPAQAVGLVERGLNAQATMLGLNDIFWISGVIFISIVPLIWLTRPAKGAAGGAVAAH
jgi:DHA2 family multidrug resistance protein